MASNGGVGDVFTPGGQPSVTYVGRARLGLEGKVRAALRRRHAFIVVAGPTKCGKSVLCKHVLGGEYVVRIEGGLINSIEMFWEHVAHPLLLPQSATKARKTSWTWTGLVEFVVGRLTPLSGKASSSGAITREKALTATYNNVLSLDAIAELKRRDAILLIEDFHFLEPQTQRAIVRALKSAVFDGLRVLILAVPHRAFDAAEVEDEVDGRIEYIDIPNWSLDDLLEIAEKGFGALKLDIPRTVQRRICEDGFGNPLLVQEICYELSERKLLSEDRGKATEAVDLVTVYNEVARRKGLNRFEQLSQAPLPPAAPSVSLGEGRQVDLNTAILGAVARLGPRTTVTYEDIQGSLEQIAEGAAIEPGQINAVLSAMTRAVARGNASPFEWEENRATLTITDPFLMFYLRWVLRDRRAIVLQPPALEVATLVPPALNSPDGEDDGS